jgi:mono/diheme cytochrome c family protein
VVRIILLILALAFIGIQFVPSGSTGSNPPVTGEPPWDSARTRELFVRACADCHSNQTVWPWYSHVAPVSWLVERDVRRGRRNLNVSEWGRARNHGDDAAEMVERGYMPLPAYAFIHPDANLSESEKQELIKGLVATFGRSKDEE